MYGNLKAEMARRDVTITELAKVLRVRIGTVSVKIRKGKFTLAEAVKIKKHLGVDMPLEELFEVKEAE